MINKYGAFFETNLNQTMCVEIKARNRREAERILKREYPSAFNIEIVQHRDNSPGGNQ